MTLAHASAAMKRSSAILFCTLATCWSSRPMIGLLQQCSPRSWTRTADAGSAVRHYIDVPPAVRTFEPRNSATIGLDMPTRLLELVEHLPAAKIVLIGDLMLDRYIYGNA